MSSLTENGKKSRSHWRPASLLIDPQAFEEEPDMLSPSTIVSPRTLTAPATPSSPFMHTESHDSFPRYPSPSLSQSTPYMVRPTPTVSTPPPSSLERKGLEKLEQRVQQRIAKQQSVRQENPDIKPRHERMQSGVVDYSAQYPSTWAYARSTSASLRPVSNMDEALVWIQQNNRLVQENLRLKKTLEEVNQAHASLARKLKEYQDQRKDEINDEQKRINETLRRVRSEERARWAEIVERLERQVRQLQQKT
ncbi:hypothetical protein BX666DRAFT_1897764 [Dichotomocladium elegans]|nr:hypothetical protein BX666DRAFT_1897764 [Dichotomocladium elegans]